MKSSWLTLPMAGILISAFSAGCLQSTVGGQSLPSAYSQDDDVQYFPAGREQKLANQTRALERYKAQRQAKQDGSFEEPGD